MKTAQILADKLGFVLTNDNRIMRVADAHYLGFAITGTLPSAALKPAAASPGRAITPAEAQQSLFADAVLALPEAKHRPRAVAKLLPHYKTMSVAQAQGFLRGLDEEHDRPAAAVDPRAARVAEIRRAFGR